MGQQKEEGLPLSNIGWLAGGVLAGILLLAMMPGLFLVSLIGSGTESIPQDNIPYCQDLSWPLRGYGREHITSYFSRARQNPVTGRMEEHGGVDIGAPSGTPIFAAADGTVTISALQSSYGNYVEITHGNGIKTRYAHMSRRGCSRGDTVYAGEVIGYVGSTGNSTGPHLHFEVWINGKRYDPMLIFNG